MINKQKVYAYITCNGQLLVFRHIDFPEAGIQVPGGTVEPGEGVLSAVYREVYEETELQQITLVEKLGVVVRDLADLGLPEIHKRHYFHFMVDQIPAERWTAYEENPSDGSAGSIRFEFYWVSLDDPPPLSGRLDEMLPMLHGK